MAEIATTMRPARMNETELQPYQPLFGPAVVSFVLGLLSVLSLIPWPLFLGLPAAAVLVGSWAVLRLRRISGTEAGRIAATIAIGAAIAVILAGFGVVVNVFARPGPVVLMVIGAALTLVAVGALAKIPKVVSDAFSGERLARMGMTLGMVFGMGGVINFQMPRELLIQSAVATGQSWLEAMAKAEDDELSQSRAIILTMHPIERPPDNVNLETLLGSKDIKNAFGQLRQLPLFRSLSKLGPRTQIRLDSVEELIPKAATEAQVVYRVTVPPQQGQSSSRYFLVMLQLVMSRNHRTHQQEWRIYDHMAPYVRHSQSIPKARPEHVHDHDMVGQ